MNKDVLYITYDGLSDPLGQSQIIPYLTGLADSGYSITIVSCEKREAMKKNHARISDLLKQKKIRWEYSIYKRKPAVISAFFNLLSLRNKSIRSHKRKNYSIVHCRSYIASLIGLEMKKRFKTKFIFDMRGFWADERVEGGLWDLKNPIYKFLYNYFKKQETAFLSNADYTISLTKKAKNIIHERKDIPRQPVPIQVIPCCVDLDHFSRKKNKEEDIHLLKKTLNISEGDFILAYLGSIGTWYCLEEMLVFFKHLLGAKPNAKFLFITPDDPENIFSISDRLTVPRDKIIIRSATYTEVPLYLSLSNLSLFFIKPCFSKSASSPTKMGELMAMEIPVVCNSGIGDTDELIHKMKNGIAIDKFSEPEYQNAIATIEHLKLPAKEIRKCAEDLFSLREGIKKYQLVYAALRGE